MNEYELKEFLDYKADQYEHPDFIQTDPIQIPHQFSKKEDIEITALIIATIAWGNRKSIISNGEKLVQLMGRQPHEFIMNYEERDYQFVHRTFNHLDLAAFFRSLHQIYQTGTLESCFHSNPLIPGELGRIMNFRNHFITKTFPARTEKHVANPLKGSSAKRLCMFLRWMIRSNAKGVDFGLWQSIPTSELHIPLDVHTGNVARKLGLLSRSQNDWKSVEAIQQQLVAYDPLDPCKYDFALFGLGAFEGF